MKDAIKTIKQRGSNNSIVSKRVGMWLNFRQTVAMEIYGGRRWAKMG